MLTDLFVNGTAILDGYAAIRASKHVGNNEYVYAIFLCPGKGTDDYCFRKAREEARKAGFTPCDEI